VRPADVPHVVIALNELGYEQHLQLSPRQEKAYLRSGYEYVFGRGTEHNLLELQWNLLPRFYSVDIDVEELFVQSQIHNFHGCSARVLSIEHQLLFLCMHAAKHQWVQLAMVRDIAALSQLHCNWDGVLREARRLGILRILCISLLLAERISGVAIPELACPEFACAERELHACRSQVPAILNNLSEMRELSTESFAYFRSMIEFRERRRDQARFLWRLATTHSVGEWTTVRLPDFLLPLYSGVRAARLVRRFLKKGS
jgi:hypothetical protein